MIFSTKDSPSLRSRSQLAFIPWASCRKADQTLLPVLALTYSWTMLCFSAKRRPSYTDTYRYSSRSLLVAISIFTTPSAVTVSICLVQELRFWNESPLVISQARMMAFAPLKQAWVMLRKRSCPAVSQTCSLTVSPSTSTSLSLKSTPIVATQLSLKTPSQYLVMRLVFPTPLSPIITTLAKNASSRPGILYNLPKRNHSSLQSREDCLAPRSWQY